MLLYRLTADIKAWPTEARRIEYASASLFAFRKQLRAWREFARYEDNYVLNKWIDTHEYRIEFVRVIGKYEVIYPEHEKYLADVRDRAHEADMAKLHKEQLRADISVDEANEELWDDFMMSLDDYEF